MIAALHLWEPSAAPATVEARQKYLDNSICGPKTQLSDLGAPDGSDWARDNAGLPVWVRGADAGADTWTTGVLPLDEFYVAHQQRRLLSIVDAALDDPTVRARGGERCAADEQLRPIS